MAEHDWMPSVISSQNNKSEFEEVCRCSRCRMEWVKWSTWEGSGEYFLFDGAHFDDLDRDPGCDPRARVCAVCKVIVVDKDDEVCEGCREGQDND